MPNTTGAKVFLFPFDIGGIILLTVTIVMARESILESFKDSYRRRRERMLAKARERRQQKKLAQEAHLHDANASPAPPADEHGILNAPKRAAHWLSARAPIPDKQPNFWRRIKAFFRKILVKLGVMAPKEDFEPGLSRSDTSMSQESAFAKFTEELKDEERKEFLNRLGIASLLFLSFWLVGSAVCACL